MTDSFTQLLIGRPKGNLAWASLELVGPGSSCEHCESLAERALERALNFFGFVMVAIREHAGPC
jgi:hypothetical protein